MLTISEQVPWVVVCCVPVTTIGLAELWVLKRGKFSKQYVMTIPVGT